MRFHTGEVGLILKSFIYRFSGKSPMAKLSPEEKEIIYLRLEKQKIEREKAAIVLNKSLALYIIFMIVGVVGFVFDYLSAAILNVLIIAGIAILIIGTLPYFVITSREEKLIEHLLDKLKGGKK
ncbi:MAG TPA: hypothetical protein DCL42_08250 [Deltaproteobacteria bacterium]|nr:hypothetical protein [Deltaproteobacteria bacterium]